MELEAHKIQSPPVGHSDRFRFGAVLLQVLVHDGLVPGVGFEEDLPAALVHFSADASPAARHEGRTDRPAFRTRWRTRS